MSQTHFFTIGGISFDWVQHNYYVNGTRAQLDMKKITTTPLKMKYDGKD